MAARRRTGRDRRAGNPSATEPLLTYPVGVLIRDRHDKVFYLSLAQLEQFRREDLEEASVLSEFNAGEPILGLKNAWLVEGIGIRSAD